MNWTRSTGQRNGVFGQTMLPVAIVRVAAVVLGWLLCEGLVRILVPGPIFYSTWFTPGVNQLDQSLGFVFTPHFVGAMRHTDGVWMEPLELDPQGFRKAAASPSTNEGGTSESIVMLGGASMAFSFGLADVESLHSQTARHLSRPSKIQVVSWPGFTLSQDLLKIDRFLDTDSIDQAVVFAYSDEDYVSVESLPPANVSRHIKMEHGVVLPQDPASRLLGALYYRSVVLAGASRLWLAFSGVIDEGSRDETEMEVSTAPTKSESTRGEPAAYLAARRLREMGIAQVLIVALPHQLRKVGPETLKQYVGDDVIVADLREMSQDPNMDWIAGGHYGPISSKSIAERIASALKNQ